MSTIQRMKAEDVLQKQYHYQDRTKAIVVEFLEHGFSKADIAEAVGIYSTEVADIQKEFKIILKKSRQKETEGTTGNKIFGSSIFGGRF
ncbi:hypothetical protein [Peribacillus frigoritolerans]|uniref:Uncharacterized protein n=1 Tax=Peribacillus frigoritolerans TaxID=450367 RepID=A0AAJ1VB12_9BACI|nr:hypothetical protein [Peribacillus frigoritolerans]MDM5283110.1 hypothetical protein [Peribacillus frigoritolerans]